MSYTNEDNFHKQLCLFLWFRNTLRLLEQRCPQNEVEKSLRSVAHLYKRKN